LGLFNTTGWNFHGGKEVSPGTFLGQRGESEIETSISQVGLKIFAGGGTEGRLGLGPFFKGFTFKTFWGSR